MIRSLGDWSGGLHQTETSIVNAYIYAIDKAEHFIYIEVNTIIYYKYNR